MQLDMNFTTRNDFEYLSQCFDTWIKHWANELDQNLMIDINWAMYPEIDGTGIYQRRKLPAKSSFFEPKSIAHLPSIFFSFQFPSPTEWHNANGRSMTLLLMQRYTMVHRCVESQIHNI